MPNATCDGESSYAPTQGRLIEGRPTWCAPFLTELRRQRDKYAACNTTLAADLAGVSRARAYLYRGTPQGRAFRIEWDLIVLEAQRFHSIRHHR